MRYESTSRFLVPAARKYGVEDPAIVHSLSIGEGGEKARHLLHTGYKKIDVYRFG